MHTFFERIDVFRNIVYDDFSHNYTINGVRTVSVTKVTGSAKPPFDNMAVSQGSATKELVAERIEEIRKERGAEYEPTQEELDNIRNAIPKADVDARAEKLRIKWARTNLISTEKGSAAHKYIESAMANKFERYPEASIRAVFGGEDPVKEKYDAVVRHMDAFKRDIAGKMIPIKSELVIGSPRYMLCGMIDQIFWNNKSGKFELWDWKTNAKFETSSKYHLQSPVSHLMQCHLDEYSLQLACYKKMFTEMTGIPLGNSYLCWFCETEPTYRVFKCKDLQAEAELLIKKSMAERGIK